MQGEEGGTKRDSRELELLKGYILDLQRKLDALTGKVAELAYAQQGLKGWVGDLQEWQNDTDRKGCEQ